MRNKSLLDNHADKLTSDMLCTLWSSFAESSRPGTLWPGFTRNGGEILFVDEGGQTSVGNAWELRLEQRTVWSDAIEDRMQKI
ncbi:hypothetical protein BDZ89DRAFT_1067370 [Hymenopellis radicata]|nr:hypothetical protein BDZ89DRAFT_1067370 [Hymenopellis radicata]